MNFLNARQTAKQKASLSRRLVPDPQPVFYFDSHPGNDYSGAGRAFVASLGAFQEATLLYLFNVRGDGWNEDLRADPQWARYRQRRNECGEMRRLSDAPGQRFSSNERDALAEAIAFTLCLGWDAWLESNRGRKLVVFSHDDRVEVHRGCERRTLKRDLTKLGFCQVAGAS